MDLNVCIGLPQAWPVTYLSTKLIWRQAFGFLQGLANDYIINLETMWRLNSGIGGVEKHST
jgi:hypothetical protein